MPYKLTIDEYDCNYIQFTILNTEKNETGVNGDYTERYTITTDEYDGDDPDRYEGEVIYWVSYCSPYSAYTSGNLFCFPSIMNAIIYYNKHYFYRTNSFFTKISEEDKNDLLNQWNEWAKTETLKRISTLQNQINEYKAEHN